MGARSSRRSRNSRRRCRRRHEFETALAPGKAMNPDDLRRALAMIDAAGDEALNATGPEEAINALTCAYIDLLGDREAHLKPGALKPGEKQYFISGAFFVTPDK